ncbi:dentin sialophosphoprotein-like isoform X2 [Clytia hemisphaerica]|uniref:Uncharacterized protein n=1 Tax=Clytia hemisphaerica TaxID=252671 RepID=A0A7M5XJL3_9CNID
MDGKNENATKKRKDKKKKNKKKKLFNKDQNKSEKQFQESPIVEHNTDKKSMNMPKKDESISEQHPETPNKVETPSNKKKKKKKNSKRQTGQKSKDSSTKEKDNVSNVESHSKMKDLSQSKDSRDTKDSDVDPAVLIEERMKENTRDKVVEDLSEAVCSVNKSKPKKRKDHANEEVTPIAKTKKNKKKPVEKNIFITQVPVSQMTLPPSETSQDETEVEMTQPVSIDLSLIDKTLSSDTTTNRSKDSNSSSVVFVADHSIKEDNQEYSQRKEKSQNETNLNEMSEVFEPNKSVTLKMKKSKWEKQPTKDVENVSMEEKKKNKVKSDLHGTSPQNKTVFDDEDFQSQIKASTKSAEKLKDKKSSKRKSMKNRLSAGKTIDFKERKKTNVNSSKLFDLSDEENTEKTNSNLPKSAKRRKISEKQTENAKDSSSKSLDLSDVENAIETSSNPPKSAKRKKNSRKQTEKAKDSSNSSDEKNAIETSSNPPKSARKKNTRKQTEKAKDSSNSSDEKITKKDTSNPSKSAKRRKSSKKRTEEAAQYTVSSASSDDDSSDPDSDTIRKQVLEKHKSLLSSSLPKARLLVNDRSTMNTESSQDELYDQTVRKENKAAKYPTITLKDLEARMGKKKSQPKSNKIDKKKRKKRSSSSSRSSDSDNESDHTEKKDCNNKETTDKNKRINRSTKQASLSSSSDDKIITITKKIDKTNDKQSTSKNKSSKQSTVVASPTSSSSSSDSENEVLAKKMNTNQSQSSKTKQSKQTTSSSSSSDSENEVLSKKMNTNQSQSSKTKQSKQTTSSSSSSDSENELLSKKKNTNQSQSSKTKQSKQTTSSSSSSDSENKVLSKKMNTNQSQSSKTKQSKQTISSSSSSDSENKVLAKKMNTNQSQSNKTNKSKQTTSSNSLSDSEDEVSVNNVQRKHMKTTKKSPSSADQDVIVSDNAASSKNVSEKTNEKLKKTNKKQTKTLDSNKNKRRHSTSSSSDSDSSNSEPLKKVTKTKRKSAGTGDTTSIITTESSEDEFYNKLLKQTKKNKDADDDSSSEEPDIEYSELLDKLHEYSQRITDSRENERTGNKHGNETPFGRTSIDKSITDVSRNNELYKSKVERHPDLDKYDITIPKLMEMGVSIATGSWSNYELYILFLNIKNAKVKFKIDNFKESYLSGDAKTEKVVSELCKNILRRRRTIRDKLDEIFVQTPTGEKKSTYSEEESKQLLELHKKYKGEWKTIAEKLDRSIKSVKQRYKLLQKQGMGTTKMKPKAFTDEEDEHLLRLVKECKDQKLTIRSGKLPWTLIAEKLESGRDSSTVRARFTLLASKTVKTAKPFLSKRQRFALIINVLKVLVSNNQDDTNDVNWEKVKQAVKYSGQPDNLAREFKGYMKTHFLRKKIPAKSNSERLNHMLKNGLPKRKPKEP